MSLDAKLNSREYSPPREIWTTPPRWTKPSASVPKPGKHSLACRAALAEVRVCRVSLAPQGQEGSHQRGRESIVWSARSFSLVRRSPGTRLLVEAAPTVDDVPDQKRELLEEAARLYNRRAAETAHRGRPATTSTSIGKPLSPKSPGPLKAVEIDLAKLRGYVVVPVFWLADSPPPTACSGCAIFALDGNRSRGSESAGATGEP